MASGPRPYRARREPQTSNPKQSALRRLLIFSVAMRAMPRALSLSHWSPVPRNLAESTALSQRRISLLQLLKIRAGATCDPSRIFELVAIGTIGVAVTRRCRRTCGSVTDRNEPDMELTR